MCTSAFRRSSLYSLMQMTRPGGDPPRSGREMLQRIATHPPTKDLTGLVTESLRAKAQTQLDELGPEVSLLGEPGATAKAPATKVGGTPKTKRQRGGARAVKTLLGE